MKEGLHIERDELERRNQNRKPKMKIEIKFTDGTSRTIGGANDIATCLDYDPGSQLGRIKWPSMGSRGRRRPRRRLKRRNSNRRCSH